MHKLSNQKLLKTFSLGKQTTLFCKFGKSSIFTERCCSFTLVFFSPFLRMAASCLVLNYSCQLGPSSLMTPFQISLNHVFILSILLDCKPTVEFHCPAVVTLTLTHYLAHSQFKFVAIYLHCYQTLHVYKAF